MKYKILAKDGRAKRADVETVHGTIHTPVFMNVGTVAAIKGAVSTDDLRGIGTQVELSNTYHLHVRTGDKLIKELGGEGFQPGVMARFNEGVKKLEEMGAEVTEVSLPHLPYSLGAYYIIMPSEVSSNLARYDGMRYGLRVMPPAGVPQTAANMMAYTREAGFGDEVKRRIILGTYALSAGYYDAWYGSAQKVRTLIQRDFDAVFEQVDVLVSPTAPETAFKFGEKTSDPLAMYLYDVATIPANLAGIPGVNVPNAVSSEGLPIGFQVLAPARGDLVMYKVASLVEALSDDVAGQCPAANWEEK